jgi:hypothetical protein
MKTSLRLAFILLYFCYFMALVWLYFGCFVEIVVSWYRSLLLLYGTENRDNTFLSKTTRKLTKPLTGGGWVSNY